MYRTDKKYWGVTKAEKSLLLSKSIQNNDDKIISYHSYRYDDDKNVVEEKIIGNLTGNANFSLDIDNEGKLINPQSVDCYSKTFSYTKDGYNSISIVGDPMGTRTEYSYVSGTNLLSKELIYSDKSKIRKRIFYFYNEDAACNKTIEDDGGDLNIPSKDTIYFTERHIREVKAKTDSPGVGLPEIIEEKTYDKKNKIEVLVKRLENQFDNRGNLLSCSTFDANGEFIYIESKEYNEFGKVLSETDRLGNVTSYKYDDLGNQIEQHFLVENRYLTTTYDFHNNPIYIQEVMKDGQWTLSNVYDAKDRKIESTDRFGNTTLYSYDNFDRLSQVVFPRVIGSDLNVSSPTFKYDYDIFGNVIKIEDPLGYSTRHEYNLRGQVTKINYPNGTYETCEYDPAGNLTKSRSAQDIQYAYRYDYAGRINHTTNVSEGTTCYRHYNAWHCTAETDLNSYVKSEYEYDFSGKLICIKQNDDLSSSVSSENKLCHLTYDSQGRLHQKKIWFDINPNDFSVDHFKYDVNGNIKEKTIVDFQDIVLSQKTFEYDTRNNCIQEYTLEDGLKTSLLQSEYNSTGDLTNIIEGYNTETKIFITTVQNSIGQTVQQKTIINPLGIQTIIEFDALGRIVSVCKKSSFGRLLSSQKNIYDLVGNKTCEIHDKIIDGKIEGDQKITWQYGPMGQLEEETKGCKTPYETKVQYTYNSLGQLSSKIFQDKDCINYFYHKNRLTKIESKSAKKDLQICNTYDYTSRGNIFNATSMNGISVKKNYNAFNQVKEEIINDGEEKYSQKYSYDKKGRLKEITLPDQSKIVYHYNAISEKAVERITSTGKSVYTHTYEQHDLRGNLLSETYIGYLGGREYQYDQCNRVFSSKTEFNNESFQRDVLGRIESVKGTREHFYAYNDLSQIISSTKQNTPSMHSYDSLDNCIKRNDKQFLSNALNQITEVSGIEYQYDPAGNLNKKIQKGKETLYQTNILSQLISVQPSKEENLNFQYDPFGRLLKKSSEGKSKGKSNILARYFYLGNHEIGTLSKTNEIENLKILGLVGNCVSHLSIAFELNKAIYVPIHDVEGNVQILTDPYQSEVVERYEYSLFGETKVLDENYIERGKSFCNNPWMFAEKRVDVAPDLIFFGLRFYDSGTGTWITPDPLGYIDGVNQYSYLHNNPVNLFDRFGLNSEYKLHYHDCPYRIFTTSHINCVHCGWRFENPSNTSQSTPIITYDDNFEKVNKDFRVKDQVIKDFWDNSSCYDLSGEGFRELPPDLGIGFINGIWNDFNSAKESARYLARLSGGYNIQGVHNATHGRFIDVVECKLGLNYIATEPVRQLHKMWHDFFKNTSENSRFLMISHSQGVIHVRNALLDFPPELRTRILVVGIAPAGYVYRNTCADVLHYRVSGWRDFVPRIDSHGAYRSKGTIVELNSHPDAPLFDHEFMSPTYTSKLFTHLSNYIMSNGKEL